ncbi:MAG: T9SS type A sorting domain-containing protein [Flavobacteriales bacterium]|nr:T9SS type A sorting domain-containing protein [Flavobacteriales bacterium]
MRTTLLALALLPLLAFAQSWCPPGATWTFGYTDILGGVVGHARVDYTADTVLAGLPAQRLEVNVNAYSYPTQSYWTEQPAGVWFTTGTDAIVQLWQPNEQAFDTLYWFTAAPGDRWSVPWTYGGVPDFIVLDTLWTTLSGQALRQVVVGLDGPSPEPIDTLTERLGFMEIFINAISPMFLVDQPFGGLRCYSDNELQWTNPTLQFGCTSLVGLANHDRSMATSIFPNPGTTNFTLDLPPRPHSITLFDATGRMVLQQRTTDARPVIATEALPAGLYRIAVRDEQGGMMGATWVKE